MKTILAAEGHRVLLAPENNSKPKARPAEKRPRCYEILGTVRRAISTRRPPLLVGLRVPNVSHQVYVSECRCPRWGNRPKAFRSLNKTHGNSLRCRYGPYLGPSSSGSVEMGMARAMLNFSDRTRRLPSVRMMRGEDNCCAFGSGEGT